MERRTGTVVEYADRLLASDALVRAHVSNGSEQSKSTSLTLKCYHTLHSALLSVKRSFSAFLRGKQNIIPSTTTHSNSSICNPVLPKDYLLSCMKNTRYSTALGPLEMQDINPTKSSSRLLDDYIITRGRTSNNGLPSQDSEESTS